MTSRRTLLRLASGSSDSADVRIAVRPNPVTAAMNHGSRDHFRPITTGMRQPTPTSRKTSDRETNETAATGRRLSIGESATPIARAAIAVPSKPTTPMDVMPAIRAIAAMPPRTDEVATGTRTSSAAAITAAGSSQAPQRINVTRASPTSIRIMG